MRYGTSYFTSIESAIAYYRPYGYDDVKKAVNRKLRDGEIHIGKPPLKTGETCQVNVEGRYIIDDGR